MPDFFRKSDGRTPESLIQRIHATVTDWEPVWASLSVQVPSSGRHGPCPCCGGGKDRFRTIPAERDRGGWICSVCGTSGDGIDLVARVHGVALAEAVGMVADVLGIRTSDDNESYKAAIQTKAAQQAERDAQQAEAYARAAALAEQMTIESSTVAAESVPYLARKGFHGLQVQVLSKDYQHTSNGREYTYKAGSLIVPLMNIEGDITSAEIINDSGKYALAGGRKKGSFGLVPAAEGVDVGVVAIAEGYATGLSCHILLEGCPVFCGMSKSGLLDAALAARKLYPDARIIVCGDAGAEREAEAAAAAVGGEVAIPPDGFGDWDDYRQSLGDAA